MPLAGVQLTIQQGLALCYNRGWRRRDLTKAVAVMTAESGRYTEAWHDNLSADGSRILSTDRGIFQLNDVAQARIDDAHAYDGVYNTMYAFKLWQANGFTPWAAFNSGRWMLYAVQVATIRLGFKWSWRRLRPTIDEVVHGYADAGS